MPNRIALVTDSTCDIPIEWVKQYDIKVVPMMVVWGKEQFLDGVDLSAEAFYARLLVDPVCPSTSQPPPSAFLQAYRQAVSEGAEEIVAITISSAMSGTIESARQAATESPVPVHIHDAKNNSMGLGWQVIAAARVREAGGDAAAMLAAAESVRGKIAYFIALDTMEYLAKGGRIGAATKFLGSVLKIKPLIYVNPATGTVGAGIPGRSRSTVIDGVYNQFFKKVNPERPLHITVLHNAALDDAQALAERVRRAYNPKEIFISIVSPALGVHTGPRAIALCGYSED